MSRMSVRTLFNTYSHHLVVVRVDHDERRWQISELAILSGFWMRVLSLVMMMRQGPTKVGGQLLWWLCLPLVAIPVTLIEAYDEAEALVVASVLAVLIVAQMGIQRVWLVWYEQAV